MAEKERCAGIGHGYLGPLTYNTSNEKVASIGEMETLRTVTDIPQFIVSPSSTVVYPPARSSKSLETGLEDTKRRQARWMLQGCPISLTAYGSYHDALSQGLLSAKEADRHVASRSLLVFGEMDDVSQGAKARSIPFVAMATGASGEALRVASLQESKWQWDRASDTSISQRVADPLEKESQIIWTSDSLPIAKIKYVSGRSVQGPARWLLVQKKHYIVILKPEYHSVASRREQFTQAIAGDSMSLITLSELLRLHTSDNGNPYSDCVFGPMAGDDSWMATIDVTGSWMLWDLGGRHNVSHHTFRLTERKSGCMVPDSTHATTPGDGTQQNNLLLCWPHVESDVDSDSDEPEDEVFRTLKSNAVILIWSNRTLEAISPQSGSVLTRQASLWKPDAKTEITDIQLSPIAGGEIFILTTKSLIQGKIVLRSDYACSLRIMATISHNGIIPRSTLASCRAERMQHDAVLVTFLDSSAHQWHVYTFYASKNKVTCSTYCRQVISIPCQKAKDPQLHQIAILPLPFDRAKEDTLLDYSKVQFFQVSLLGEDLQLRQCLLAGTLERIGISFPTIRKNWDLPTLRRKWKRQHKFFRDHAQGMFILPDNVTDTVLESLFPLERPFDLSVARLSPTAKTETVQKRLNYTRCAMLFGDMIKECLSIGEVGIHRQLLDSITHLATTNLGFDGLPLTQWSDVESGACGTYDKTLEEHFDMILAGIQKIDDRVILLPLRRAARGSLLAPADAKRILGDMWSRPLNRKLTTRAKEYSGIWVSRVCRDLILASGGLSVRPLQADITDDESNRRVQLPPSSQLASSSQAVVPSQNWETSSQTSSAGAASAVSRLRHLARGIGENITLTSSAHLLKFWPDEPGADLEGYVSSVTMATDDKFRDARERQLRREARRKSHAEKYNRLSTIRQSLPRTDPEIQATPVRPVPVQIMSSQQRPIESSQINPTTGPAFTMSQPLAGPFGDRKKKKPKRKSGFR